ncbi:MAG: SDR family NAD(P)-dependent oxidoreductase [Acidobacteriota bacterium]
MSRYEHSALAMLSGIRNLFGRAEPIGDLRDTMRLDGGTALVTGASSGVGFAAAVELARRGLHVVGVARTATPDVTSALRAAAGVDSIEMLPVDFADLDLVDALLDTLEARGLRFDLVVFNAAIVPVGDRRTPQGLEQMFVVNFLAQQALADGLHRRGLIAPSPSAESAGRGPRLVVVSSETHRNAQQRPFESFDEYQGFGRREVLARYGMYKLALTTLAYELSRRLEPEGIAVHVLCPGAVNTRIARDAPRWMRPLLKIVFRLIFQSPAKAVGPLVYLALAPELEGETGIYLHQWVRKDPDLRAVEPELGDRQWRAAAAVLERAREQR